MIQVLLYPDALSMVGSMNAFEIYCSSKTDVVFALRYQGSSTNIVQHTYTPNDKNRITLSVKDIILPLLSFELKDSSEPYVQPNIMKSFVATLYEVGSEDSKKYFTFSVIRAGVDRLSDSATNFLKNNFLTWQPQVKAVTYYSPEFLTYYATAPSVMKCKAYMWNGTAYEEKEVILMNHMNAGTVYTVPVQYAIIAKKIGGSIQPSYYDIWVELDGNRVTYVQRYYASDMKSEEEEWFLFENSLGGVDCFRAYGNSENTAEHTHNVAEIEEDSEEYRVDTTRKFKKNTGFLDKKERLWLLDFFPSLGKYVYHGNSLRKITVTESDVNYEAKELPSDYTFTYKYSDARPYLNLTRSDASDFEKMDIHLPEIGNFTIAPRLVEFPRQLLSGGVLFPVQEPYSETWGVTTADAIFSYFASTLSDRYSGGGGIGHQHFNIEVLNGLSYDYGYILYKGDRIKAGMADDCTPGGALEKKMLRKDIDDTAKGKITFEDVISLLKGLKLGDGKSQITGDGLAKLYAFMTYNFVSGVYGSGASIDNNGDAEMNSLFVRQFISAPKFVFNEISVTKAEQWNTNGYGTIESVDTEKHTISLHLEGNDYGSLQVGDICRGIYADLDNVHGSDKNTEGALDDCNFVLHKGFFTTYFYVKKIITSEKGKFAFEYGKRSETTPDPCAYMDFAQYGSFTDDKRQSSMYFSSRGNSYIEVLDGVCNWEIYPQNRVCRYGWLDGLSIQRRDGSYIHPSGNGIFVQDNVYFGGNVEYLGDILGLDDLKNEAKAYDVSLSQYQSVVTVDDMGNVINGLYTQDEGKATKQYRISTAVFVRKGMDILLEEDAHSENVTEGHYRLHVISDECDVEVKNSTVFVKGIRNIKDGVAGTADDTNFDYAAMRKMSDAMVTIVVELEGKTSKTVQMPIRIQHDSLPFMVCDLSNESASVAWNTRAGKYIGFPIKTKVSIMYHNEPWAISSLNISEVSGLKASWSVDGNAKVITIDADNLTADTLAQITKMNITVVGKYAGASYEYTRELTILKSSDTVVYDLIPSSDSIVVDKDGNKTVNSVSCDVYATSSDDKRYKLTVLPYGMSLKYGKGENATTSVALGAAVDVLEDDKMVTFALYDKNNQILDKESVPVLAFGKDGKGIEYIFKLQNSAPSNPTPSDYATNAEYQRTDQEFIPDGWTDDPTGVDAVNQYEWVCKRVSTNGHWGAFSEPAKYAHFGKHAPKAKSSDDIVTIPTDSNGNALLAFSEEVGFSLLVDGHECNISSIQKYSSTLSHVSCSISGNVATITCEEGATIGITSQTAVFKVTGTLDGSSYSDYVTVKIVPNVTGSDGDGYEYIYYLSSSSSASSIPTPRRQNGILQDNWQDDPMPPTVDKQYVYVAYKNGVVGSNGTFSAPKLFNRYPKSIAKQETKFYTNSSLTPAPLASTIWNNGSTTMPTDFNDSNPWLWKIIRTTYTDGTTDDVISCEGYKAKDGIGIKSVNTWYGLSKSMTSQPSSFTYDTLSKVVIETHAVDYVWSADKVTYTNNDEAFTGIYCIGKCSDLASVTEQYGTSASDKDKPTSWDDVYPTDASKGTYIWSRDKIVWKDGKTAYSDAQLIGYIATDGKHAPKASSTDDIVTIPTDSKGNALVAFSEDIHFSLRVDGRNCNISSVVIDRAATTDVSYSISGNTASISCAEGARLGMVAQTIVFKVTGTLDDGSSYSDYVTVKVVPNVTGSDGDGYEYIYYLSSSSSASSIPTPRRQNGILQDNWQDDPMAPTVDKQYVYVAYKKGVVGSDGTFSEPKLFNRYPKSISRIETWYYAGDSSDVNQDPTLFRKNGSQDFNKIAFNDATPWLWIMKITWFTDGDEVINFSCGGYKAKDGDGLIVGYQSSASEPSVLPTTKTLADYNKAQDDIGHGWTKTAPSTGGKSIVPGGKITTDEIVDRYNSSTSAWGTEESEILLDGIKQKITFYKTPSSLGDNGKCIRRIKVVNHFRDSYLRVMLKSYSEASYDLVCISRLYLPSEVINNKGEQIKEDSEYLRRSKYAYAISGDGQSLVEKLSMPDAGEYYFFIGYFKDVSNDYFGDYGLFAWQSMIALTESLWRTDGTVDAVGNITWSKAMPMQAEAIVMERAYIATANDTLAPSKPYRTNGILQGGWTAKRLAVSSVNRFIWESVRAGKHGTDSVQDDWSQPVIVANFAEAGKMGKNGCIVRNSEGWKSGATYHNDSALTLEQKYIDLIYIEDSNANDGWSIYQCNVTHTATGSSFDPSATDSDGNRLWIKLSDAGPMYSPLIVGKNAVLKFAQGQQFNLMEGNNIFGSFRWVKNNADYAFWIGGVSGDVATTSITRGGKFKTTDADITGKITAKSGFIGDFTIADGSIKYTSTTKTCELCKDYIQYADTANNQSLYFGYGDSGVKAEFTAKDKNNNDMTCAMISGEDGVNQNKIVAFTTAMTGYTSKLTPYELKLGDYFNTYVQIRVADDISNYGSHRLGKPTTGLKCLVDKKASTLYLFLAGIPSGIPSVATKGMIYEENGVLKIYK